MNSSCGINELLEATRDPWKVVGTFSAEPYGKL